MTMEIIFKAQRKENNLNKYYSRLYTENHHYKGEFSYSETLYRQGLIEQDKNFEGINRGTFFQSSAKIDDIQDPEVTQEFISRIMILLT